MNTSARLVSATMVFLFLAAATSSAAITPITGVQAGTNGNPPYMLESITVGDFTITRDSLVLGTSCGQVFLFSDIHYADDFNLNSVASRNGSGIWSVINIGGESTYSDINGKDPDFFVFDAGMNDVLNIRAILADGTLGQFVTVPVATWGDTGLDRVGIYNYDQSIGGIAFSITDLLDAEGRPLAADTAIRGLQFNSPNVDPVSFSAAMAVPEPATLAILGLGGLLMLRRKH